MKLFFTLMLTCVCDLGVMAENVKIGFAVEDVTPNAEDIKDGIRIGGWGGAKSKELQPGDRLYVRAMAMRDKNDTLLVIVTADTEKFHPGDACMLQEWFEKTFKVNCWHLLMNASHTHQAPESYVFNGAYAKPYHEIFIRAVKSVIGNAVKNAVTPMTVKFAKLQIQEDMTYNKNYGGICQSKEYLALPNKFNFTDTDFPVFAFSDTKTNKIMGFLWSVAAHPTYVGSGSGGMRISSHAPGAVARALQKIYGEDVVSMFTQGAAGDLKMQFPDLPVEYRYLAATKTRGFVWTQEPDKDKELTQEQYFSALNDYGMLYAEIIKKGFADGNFKEVKDIELKIAGSEVKIPLSLQEPLPKAKTGVPNRSYWKRPEGSAESYLKVLRNANSTEMERYRAHETLLRIYDDKHAAYTLFMTRVMFNKHLQIAAMSNEVCCEIGQEVKKYYRQQDIETVFWGYTPFGAPYYPSNLHYAEGTYQGAWMHPPTGFDFNKFALENLIELEPK